MAELLSVRRLYNAIRKGNTGFVRLYMMSVNDASANVQQFKQPLLYQAWLNGGADPGMLDAILVCDRLRAIANIRGTGRSSTFLSRVMDRTMSMTTTPANLSKLRQICLLVPMQLHDNFPGLVCKALYAGKSWPFPLMAGNQSLSTEVINTMYDRASEDVQYDAVAELVDWYLDMFGPITNVDATSNYLHRMLTWHPDLFVKLIPTEEVQHKVFNVDYATNEAREGHELYLKIKPYLSWL